MESLKMGIEILHHENTIGLKKKLGLYQLVLNSIHKSFLHCIRPNFLLGFSL